MKKKLFALALFAVALISCEKDNSQFDERSIPVKEQQELLDSSMQKALQGYDISCFKPVMEDFFRLLNERTTLIAVIDSVTSNPDFIQWVQSDDNGSKMNLSIELKDSVAPMVTFASLQNEEHHIVITDNEDKTDISLGWWWKIDATKKIPDRIYCSIRRNDSPALDLMLDIQAFGISEIIYVELELQFGEFRQNLTFDYNFKEGAKLSLNTFNQKTLLADFNISSDFDMTGLQDFGKEQILAWLMNYELFRSISFEGGVMNGKVKAEASLSNPFENPLMASAVIPLMNADSIPADKAHELYDLLSPYVKNAIMFEGYSKPQAGFSLFGKDGFDAKKLTATSGKYETLVKVFSKIVEAIKTKESMIIISTVMSLYPTVVSTLQQETGSDFYVHIPESDQNREQYIPIWEYFKKDTVKGLLVKPVTEIFEGLDFQRLVYSIMSIYPAVVDTIKRNLNLDSDE